MYQFVSDELENSLKQKLKGEPVYSFDATKMKFKMLEI